MVQRLTRWAWAAAAVCAVAGLYEARTIYRAERFNDAVRAGELERAGELNHAHGRFARAYALQQRGAFDPAVKAYGAVAAPPGSQLEAAVTFNLANLYLDRALAQGHVEAAADDLTVPLVELAKQHYRELLRGDPGDWEAKYNLELALVLLPDVPELESGEEFMPEHSRRAIAPKQAYEQLP